MTPPCEPDEAYRNQEHEGEDGSAWADHRSILDGCSHSVGQSHKYRLKIDRQ